MKKLGLLKENSGVSVVALTPDNVKKLIQHYDVLVEKGAGDLAGYYDSEFAAVGAQIVVDRSSIFENAEIIITHSANVDFTGNTTEKTVIGSYAVLDEFSSVLQFKHTPINFYSLALLPRTTKAQSMDILSSQAAMSGYQAVISGFHKSNVIAPMISSAGGTLHPANVLVLGAGIAGLQAIATAKRLGAIVNAFDIRKQTKTEVESLGATFIEVTGAKEDEASGGYAIEQDENFITKVQESISHFSKNADLVITTARIPGKTAPKLITKSMLEQMKNGSVVIDLASDTGGNCAHVKHMEENKLENVLLIGEAYPYNAVARSTSILLGNNYTAFIEHFRLNEELGQADEILNSTMVTKAGKVVHQRLIEEINTY